MSASGRIERLATVATIGSMLATPFTPRGGRGRRALTSATVVAGALRTAAVDVSVLGPARSALRTAVVGGLTFGAELIGVRHARPFGPYAYTGALRPTAGGVPVVVPLAWYAVAVPAAATADAALGDRSTAASRIGLGAVALTAWDLFLDPQMTAEGFWRWHRPGRYRGIPVANYLGWAAVGVAVMGAIELTRADARDVRLDGFAVRDVGDVGDAGDVGDVGAARSDRRHVVGYLAVGALETIAFATFWRDRTVAVAGGLAMLPLGVVALARRPTRLDR